MASSRRKVALEGRGSTAGCQDKLHDQGRADGEVSAAVAAACFRAGLPGAASPAGERTARVSAGYWAHRRRDPGLLFMAERSERRRAGPTPAARPTAMGSSPPLAPMPFVKGGHCPQDPDYPTRPEWAATTRPAPDDRGSALGGADGASSPSGEQCSGPARPSDMGQPAIRRRTPPGSNSTTSASPAIRGRAGTGISAATIENRTAAALGLPPPSCAAPAAMSTVTAPEAAALRSRCPRSPGGCSPAPTPSASSRTSTGPCSPGATSSALRRVEGQGGDADADLGRRDDRQPTDPATDQAPAAAQEAPGPGLVPRRGGKPGPPGGRAPKSPDPARKRDLDNRAEMLERGP